MNQMNDEYLGIAMVQEDLIHACDINKITSTKMSIGLYVL